MLIDKRLCSLFASRILLAVCLLLAAAPALAQQDLALPDDPLANPDQWLTEDTWGELRYGLNIREPHDATRVPDTPQGDVMRWAIDDGTRIRLAFARGEYEGLNPDGTTVRTPAHINNLKIRIDDEMRAAVAGTVVNTNANQVIEVDGMIGVINYFVITPNAPGTEPYLFGYALLQLDDRSVAVLRMECPPDQIVSAVSTFECMVHSIDVEPAEQVLERIGGWVANGDALLDSLTQQDRLDAMRSDRLYRILENGQDLGYSRVWQRFQDDAYYEALQQRLAAEDPAARLDGIDALRITGNAIIVQSHYRAEGTRINRLYEAVDALQGDEEFWQIKNTLTYENDPNNRRAGTWVETGIQGTAFVEGHALDRIHVTREGTPPRHLLEFILDRESDPNRRLRAPSVRPRAFPQGDIVELAWPTPPRAYLSFVDAQLMPAMLPNEPRTYCFGAYDPETSRVDIRYMRVEPRADGGKTVYLRPVLDQSEQMMVFDTNGELVRHTFPDGRSLQRTTRQELARIWGVRLRE